MISEAVKAELIEISNHWRTLWRKQLESWSGTDQVQAERYRIISDALKEIAEGKDSEEAIREMGKRWRAYADEWNKKVAEAPKMKRGPMSGASAIHYKHCSHEAIEANQIHVRNILNIVVSRNQAVGG